MFRPILHVARRCGSRASGTDTLRRRLPGRIPLLCGVLAVVVSGVSCAGEDATPQRLVGFRPDSVRQVDGFSFEDGSNDDAAFVLKARPRGLLLTFFGYTNCTDVCPTALAVAAGALDLLGSDSSRVDVAMVTIDPARDTADVLSAYVRQFIPGAHALRTDDDAVLRESTALFDVQFMLTGVGSPTEESPSVTVGRVENEVAIGGTGGVESSHSHAMYVVDDAGQYVLNWEFGVTATDMAADLRLLLERVDEGGS